MKLTNPKKARTWNFFMLIKFLQKLQKEIFYNLKYAFFSDQGLTHNFHGQIIFYIEIISVIPNKYHQWFASLWIANSIVNGFNQLQPICARHLSIWKTFMSLILKRVVKRKYPFSWTKSTYFTQLFPSKNMGFFSKKIHQFSFVNRILKPKLIFIVTTKKLRMFGVGGSIFLSPCMLHWNVWTFLIINDVH